MALQKNLGEIRSSTIRTLADKARRQSYEKYLLSLRLTKIRLFSGATISFHFPVTALIGPNGGGKTTVLGVCGCVYSDLIQGKVFKRSRFGDEPMDGWTVGYEVVDKLVNPRGSISGMLQFKDDKWLNSELMMRREVAFLSLMRTLPLAENPNFQIKGRLTKNDSRFKSIEVEADELHQDVSARIRQEGERVLGKSLAGYRFYTVTVTSVRLPQHRRWEEILLPDGRRARVMSASTETTEEKRHSISETMYVGKNEIATFSELNFGAGESSALRIIADIESLPDNSLVLIDEIENGLHPIAVRRLIEYLIDVADRKRIQAIFTTHSDYALAPLPGEAIWACLDGNLQQGRLSVPALRAISGRIEKRLAIFVEDDFVAHWITAIIREQLREAIDEVGIYAVGGDGNAVKTHRAHLLNPSVSFRSLCYIDGDSQQKDENTEGVFRMPGGMPETTVFNSVVDNLRNNVALLTIACQRPIDRQAEVELAIRAVARANRDPHLLFVQVGERLGFVPEAIVRGAFLTIWLQENKAASDVIAAPISAAMDQNNR